MKVWFDTEFIEDGKTIELISIGAVNENGGWFYAEIEGVDYSRASDWVKENVITNLSGGDVVGTRESIAIEFKLFAGDKPEFWAYYADYDWVALCQLYGTMMDLPKDWPMYCRDIKQWCDYLGNPNLPDQSTTEHDALEDAKWNKEVWEFLNGLDNPTS